VWSGVVSGTQAAVLPAYRPSFQPVPLLHSVSNVDICQSTPPSKHSKRRSPSSSSSQLSHEGVSCEPDGTGNNYDARHLSPAFHCPAADGTLQREESSDSGGIFLTPTPTCTDHEELNLDSKCSSVCRNSRSSSTDLPVASLVYVGRRFGRLSDTGDVEYYRKDFFSRKSLPGNLQTAADTGEGASHEPSASDLSDALNVRSNSCYGVPYHRPDEQFVAPTKTKKKTKKSRRNSQPGQVGYSSAKSMAVYGGNPKWVWKS